MPTLIEIYRAAREGKLVRNKKTGLVVTCPFSELVSTDGYIVTPTSPEDWEIMDNDFDHRVHSDKQLFQALLDGKELLYSPNPWVGAENFSVRMIDGVVVDDQGQPYVFTLNSRDWVVCDAKKTTASFRRKGIIQSTEISSNNDLFSACLINVVDSIFIRWQAFPRCWFDVGHIYSLPKNVVEFRSDSGAGRPLKIKSDVWRTCILVECPWDVDLKHWLTTECASQSPKRDFEDLRAGLIQLADKADAELEPER